MSTDPIDADGQTPLERVPTGIPGLDIVLRGGFLKAGIYIVRGEPGTGKTIVDLANARGMYAQSLEIFLGLLYLSYTDDPAKEARGRT